MGRYRPLRSSYHLHIAPILLITVLCASTTSLASSSLGGRRYGPAKREVADSFTLVSPTLRRLRDAGAWLVGDAPSGVPAPTKAPILGSTGGRAEKVFGDFEDLGRGRVGRRLGAATSNEPSPPQCRIVPDGRPQGYPVQLPALRRLYDGLGGKSWRRQVNWTSSENVCDFEGANCDDACQVEAITLAANELSGSLWEGMFDAFPKLYLVDLAVNKLEGSIPAGLFANNRDISDIVLSHNYLTGDIESMDFPNSTVAVHLNDNRLVGSFPQSVFQLPKLETLLAGSNAFQGTLPPDLSLLTDLRTLSLSSCNFTGALPDISQNKELTVFDASYNSLVGSLSDVQNLTKLTHLKVHHNRIRGTLPESVALLPAVQEVRLEYNRLSCALPSMNASSFRSSLPGMVSMLSGNLFKCPLPAELIRSDPGANTYYCGTGLELFLAPVVCGVVYAIGVAWHAWPWGRFRLHDNLSVDEHTQDIEDMGELGPGSEAVSYIKFSKMTVWFAFISSVLGAGMLAVYYHAPAEYECRQLLAVTAAYITGEQSELPMLVHVVLVAVSLWWLHKVRVQRALIWGAGARASTDQTTQVLRKVSRSRRAELGLHRGLRYVKLSFTTLLLLFAYLVPSALYVLLMRSYSIDVKVKRTATVLMAFLKAWINVSFSPWIARAIVRRLTRPFTLKHRFEYEIRIAGLLTVINAVLVPAASTLLFDRICFFNKLLSPEDQIAHIPEKICTHMSNFTTHECDHYEVHEFETTIANTFIYDNRCPSQVLQLFGTVFVHTMMVQNVFATGVSLIRDTKSGSRLSLAMENLMRRLACMAPLDSTGTHSDRFLVTLVSKYNQIVALVAVVLVYGSLFPPITFVALVCALARTYADARLVRRGMDTGAHREWDPQGARGLPLTSFGIILLCYAAFVGWFYGAGLVTSATYKPIGTILVAECVLGLLGLRFKWFSAVSACLNDISTTANEGRYEKPRRARTEGEMPLMGDFRHTDVPAAGLVDDEIRAYERSHSRGNSGGGRVVERLRRLSSGDAKSLEPPVAEDSVSDDSLRGVGGRVLVRSDFEPSRDRRSGRRATGARKHRENSGQIGAPSWGGPSPFLGAVEEEGGGDRDAAWDPRAESPQLRRHARPGGAFAGHARSRSADSDASGPLIGGGGSSDRGRSSTQSGPLPAAPPEHKIGQGKSKASAWLAM